MAKKLALDTVSTEELLKLLGENPEEATPIAAEEVEPTADEHRLASPDVFNFIATAGIKLGTTKVPQDKIYEAYVKMVDSPLPIRKFFKEFRRFFPQEKRHGIRFFRLDPTSLGLPSDFSIFKTKYGYRNPADIARKWKQRKNDKAKKETQETKSN
jgi:hypothetical protein